MPDSWKPAGYSSVSPYLVVSGAAKTVDFLKEVFDAEVMRIYERKDGSIMHVELMIDDSVVMLSDATANWQATVSNLHVYVRNVSAVYDRAVRAGYVSVLPPEKKEGDPDRRCGIRDPGGNVWWIATQET